MMNRCFFSNIEPIFACNSFITCCNIWYQCIRTITESIRNNFVLNNRQKKNVKYVKEVWNDINAWFFRAKAF